MSLCVIHNLLQPCSDCAAYAAKTLPERACCACTCHTNPDVTHITACCYEPVTSVAPPGDKGQPPGATSGVTPDSPTAVTHRPLTYLAGPYSHPDRAVRVGRFECLNAYAAQLMAAGELVYSPISHTHPIAEAGALPLGWEFWKKYDTAFIEHSRRVVVMMLDGWKESKGVTAEIEIAVALGTPVDYVVAAPGVLRGIEEGLRADVAHWQREANINAAGHMAEFQRAEKLALELYHLKKGT